MPIPAATDDPWIGVHVLTEFIFCPRAGLIEHEQRHDDDGEERAEDELDAPRLDYSPTRLYELQAIEHELAFSLGKARRRLPVCHVVAAVIALSCVVAAAMWNWHWLFALPLAAAAYVIALQHWRRILALVRQRAAALRATPNEPDVHSQENQPVNWWRLFQAGFESIAYKDALRFEPWRLAGRPWRVLRRGSLRIPVFRKRRGSGPNARQLRRQHYARIAAYCLLLERVEGAESPYGIVIFGEGYDGVAIPANHAGTMQPLRQGLALARGLIRDAEQGREPGKPASGNPCSGCPLGKPLHYRPGHTEHRRFGHTLPVVVAIGADRRQYHSACGDRFDWTPPHSKARRLRIA